MKKFKGVRIAEAQYELPNEKKSKIGVLMYHGDGDPKSILKSAVSIYVQNSDCYREFIDSQLNCPWLRVVLSDINNMKQEDFDEDRHRIDNLI
jgi:hypothetical protein